MNFMSGMLCSSSITNLPQVRCIPGGLPQAVWHSLRLPYLKLCSSSMADFYRLKLVPQVRCIPGDLPQAVWHSLHFPYLCHVQDVGAGKQVTIKAQTFHHLDLEERAKGKIYALIKTIPKQIQFWGSHLLEKGACLY
eukprot:1155624-Pelagomonas_calceolata.AAC.1